jgi:hypothetical protein
VTPVPLDLPLRPAEAAEVGTLIFEQAERKPLTDEVRNRIAARAAVLQLESLTPRLLSLARDPIHPSSYYFAAKAGGQPTLLHIALATAPTSSVFPKPLLIGRMRRAGGPELIINAIPFGPADEDHIEKFVSRVDTAFLPRPQGTRPAIVVESSAPEAFETFRAIWKKTGKNLAAITAPVGVPPRKAYYAGLWGAIWSGWREGYALGIEMTIAPDSVETGKDSIRDAPGYSCFALDISRLGERGLEVAAQMHEFIRQTRSARKITRSFDFEINVGLASADRAGEVLEWLRSREHAAQFLACGVGQVGELAEVARRNQCVLSIRGSQEDTPEALQSVGRATMGHFQFKASGVLSELPAIAEQLLA